MPKQDDPERKFKNYRGNYLAYDKLWESKISYEKYKKIDNLSGNSLINLTILTTNKEKSLVF